jgi:flagellar motor switch protein FliG
LDPASAQRLRSEIARVGAFRLTDAEAAQTAIADRLRNLHDQGQITLPTPVGSETILV